MSSSNGTPPVDPNQSDGAFASNGLDAGEKPRLTEEEKKQNHIASGNFPPVSSFSFLSFWFLLFLTRRRTMTTCSPETEQKRRQAIREGFDRLCELVPGLEGMGRSEGVVLQRTVEFMRTQLKERRELIDRVEGSGGRVDDDLKK